ncbi:sensor histidine kinase [Actinomadura flavalba]|uniref:sensor histidine kinase n=1 Tax=Actinomadura flavalba TaxID=1120938 RepID=UPI00035DC4CB|nr:HAMP domain-containing sensor histidine kinase [Actinomadura flavalba]
MAYRHRLWPPACWSLRLRVTVVATAVFAVLVLLGVFGFYTLIRATLYSELEGNGAVAVSDVAAAARKAAPGALVPRRPGFSLLQVVDEKGRVLAASPELSGEPPMTRDRPPGREERLSQIVSVPGAGDQVYVVASWVRAPDGWRVAYAAAPLPALERTTRTLIGALALVVPVTLAIVAWVVWHAVRRALRPVRRMRAELSAITGGDDDGRVSVPSTGDEVAALAESVNVTLRRLNKVLERQRAYVADVSHELRSPLTGLRTELEAALEHPDDEDWPTVARAALDDAERLHRLVADLLTMVKLDAGVPLEREAVDLGDLVAKVAHRRKCRVSIGVEEKPGILVWAVPSTLVQVMTNLLDNAERHARSRIEVRVRVLGDEAVVTVADDGSGIAATDRERVFRRFERLAESRARDRGGSGLGLAISREIAEMHGGSLQITDDGLTSDPRAEPGSDRDAEAGPEWGAEPGSARGGGPGVEPGAEPGSERGVKRDGGPGGEPGAEPGSERGAERSTEPGVERGVGRGVEWGAEPGGEAGAGPGVEGGAGRGAGRGIEWGAEPGGGPGAGRGAEPSAGSGVARRAERGGAPGSGQGGEQGGAGGSERGGERNAGQGAGSDGERGVGSGSEQDAAPGSERAAGQGGEQGGALGSEWGAGRGGEPGVERGVARGAGRGAGSGGERSVGSGSERGAGRGSERGAAPGSERGAGRGAALELRLPLSTAHRHLPSERG